MFAQLNEKSYRGKNNYINGPMILHHLNDDTKDLKMKKPPMKRRQPPSQKEKRVVKLEDKLVEKKIETHDFL